MLKNVKGCTIDWKEGKDLTKRVKKVKQRAKGGKSTRVVSRTEGQESFFDFFQNVSMPSEDEDDQEVGFSCMYKAVYSRNLSYRARP